MLTPLSDIYFLDKAAPGNFAHERPLVAVRGSCLIFFHTKHYCKCHLTRHHKTIKDELMFTNLPFSALNKRTMDRGEKDLTYCSLVSI